MARSIETLNGGQLPWPTRYVCDDGEIRNLAKFIASEWANHPDVQAGANGFPPGDERGCSFVLYRNRIRAAPSVGRSALDMVSAMAGRPPRQRVEKEREE